MIKFVLIIILNYYNYEKTTFYFMDYYFVCWVNIL